MYIFGLEKVPKTDVSWNSTPRRRLTSYFPSTLETLHIFHYYEHLPRLTQALSDLLLYKSEEVPVLTKLILQGPVPEEKSMWDDLASLYAQGKQQGIIMSLTWTCLMHDLIRPWPHEEPLVIRRWSLDRGFKGFNRFIKDETAAAGLLKEWRMNDVVKQLNIAAENASKVMTTNELRQRTHRWSTYRR